MERARVTAPTIKLLELLIVLALGTASWPRERTSEPPICLARASALPPESAAAAASAAANETAREALASNSSLQGGNNADGAPVVRSSELSTPGGASSAPSNQQRAPPEARQDADVQQLDAAAAATTSARQQVQRKHSAAAFGNHRAAAAAALHANHKNYPLEPFPSASYTTLAAALQPNGGHQPNGANLTAALLERDHHDYLAPSLGDGDKLPLAGGFHEQLLAGAHQQAAYARPVVEPRNGFSGRGAEAASAAAAALGAYNQLLDSLSSAAAVPPISFSSDTGPQVAGAQQQQQHAPLNAALIQNLTAGLFPVNKLSNAALVSLSELLSTKTTKPAANQSAVWPPMQLANSQQQQQQASHQAHYLEALLGDQRFSSMLDLLASPPPGAPTQASAPVASQFGFREPSSLTRFPAPPRNGLANQNGNTNQLLASRSNRLHDMPAQIIVGARGGGAAGPPASKASNVYNTYLPFRQERERAAASKQQQQQQQQPLTNGQMLNMAATLYDNYLDQHYRYPLMASSQQQQAAAAAEQQQQQQQLQQQYQFVQAHNANNQNHLDKIVYHSTPFRPSIVSPPAQQALVAPNATQQQQQQQQSYQRPKSEADSKSMSYATLGNNHNNLSSGGGGSSARDFAQANASSRLPTAHAQGNRFVANEANRFEQQQQQPFARQHEQQSDFESIYDHIQGARKQASANQTAASSSQQQQQQQAGSAALGGKAPDATTSRGRPAAGSSARATPQPAPPGALLSGPQLLLDLYERAIDSQIQEAISSNHQQHFQQLTAGAASLQQPAPVGSLAAASASWPFDEFPAATYSSALDSAGGGGGGGLMQSASRQPSGAVALGHPSGAGPFALGAPQSAPGESLASALQELPTFSASDLQPMMPALAGAMGEQQASYSLAPPAGAAPSGFAPGAQQVAAAASQLLNFNSANGLAGQPALLGASEQAADSSALASALAAQLFALPTASGAHQADATAGGYNQLFAAEPELTAAAAPAASYFFHDNRLLAAAATPFQLTHSGGSPLAPLLSGAGQQQLQQQQQQSAPAPSPPAQAGESQASPMGLSALLTKLQAGQISSILTSPLAHIYANLPRYRYTKARQPAPAPALTASASTASHAHSFARPPKESAAHLSRQQAAAALAAARAAKLIASSGYPLTPLQAAMIQAQAATSAYLASPGEPLGAELPPGGHTLLEAPPTALGGGSQQQPQAAASQQYASTSLALSGLAAGLAGGGVSPLVWRNILAPINWARKQTTGGASTAPANNTAQGLHGSQAVRSALGAPGGRQSLPLALVSTIWNNNSNNNLPFSHLFSTAASQQQQQQQTLASSAAAQSATNFLSSDPQQKRAPGRLKIKILKIPVAFYDSSAALADGAQLADQSGAASSPASSISLMPVHLQPSPTASLLASLACPLHDQQQAAAAGHFLAAPGLGLGGPAGALSAPASVFSLPQGGAGPQSQQFKANHLPFQYQVDQLQEALAGRSPNSSLNSNSASGPAAHDKAGGSPLRDFTDINQPNDLQVSPSTTSIEAAATSTSGNNQFVSKPS